MRNSDAKANKVNVFRADNSTAGHSFRAFLGMNISVLDRLTLLSSRSEQKCMKSSRLSSKRHKAGVLTRVKLRYDTVCSPSRGVPDLSAPPPPKKSQISTVAPHAERQCVCVPQVGNTRD